MIFKNGWFLRICSILFFAIFLVNISGCSTIKGVAKGFSEGIKEDWQVMKKWDENFRENWW
ncbi:MAG: hypothetical protein V1674_00910 [Candidatus Omnitrophota bacterium]